MTPILLLIAVAALYGWWNAGRAATEVATQLGRNACEAAGVIWLDQSVHVSDFRVRRHEDGWLGLERTFRFEYSYHGDDRHTGKLVLLGDKLVSFTGPAKQTVVPFER